VQTRLLHAEAFLASTTSVQVPLPALSGLRAQRDRSGKLDPCWLVAARRCNRRRGHLLRRGTRVMGRLGSGRRWVWESS